MKHLKTLVPKDMYLPLALTLLANAAAYWGTRIFTGYQNHFDLSNPVDDKIPLVPWTVSIYFGCYVFWIINYIIGCRQDKKTAYRFISADFLAKLVCLTIFLLFPTTNIRPEIVGEGFWNDAMRFLYQIDAADNLLPSIHCLTSWFCYIAVRKNKWIPRWYRIASLVMALMVCVSTLTTKQHVLIDVASGVALAEGSYFLVNKINFAKIYRLVCIRAEGMFLRKRVSVLRE